MLSGSDERGTISLTMTATNMYTNVRLERDLQAAENFWFGTFYTSLDRYRHRKICGLNRDISYLSNIFFI